MTTHTTQAPDLRALLTQAYGQIRHLVDDLTVAIDDDGLTRYVLRDAESLTFSNLICALIPLAADMATAIASPDGHQAPEAMTDEQLRKAWDASGIGNEWGLDPCEDELRFGRSVAAARDAMWAERLRAQPAGQTAYPEAIAQLQMAAAQFENAASIPTAMQRAENASKAAQIRAAIAALSAAVSDVQRASIRLVCEMLDSYIECIQAAGDYDRWHYIPQVEVARDDLRAILALRPQAVPMTRQQLREEFHKRTRCILGGDIHLAERVAAVVETFHGIGITAQATREPQT